MSLKQKFILWINNRTPDFIIGGADDPYLIRWHLIPRNRVFNIYIHYFLRSDDDRALHDHPWWNASYLMQGSYTEHTIAAGGVEHRHIRTEGAIKCRSGAAAHRIELHNGPCWTVFITGPVYRRWGFHCPKQGWIYYRKFVATHDSGSVGKGCDA
jgi:hypothetical protein